MEEWVPGKNKGLREGDVGPHGHRMSPRMIASGLDGKAASPVLMPSSPRGEMPGAWWAQAVLSWVRYSAHLGKPGLKSSPHSTGRATPWHRPCSPGGKGSCSGSCGQEAMVRQVQGHSGMA